MENSNKQRNIRVIAYITASIFYMIIVGICFFTNMGWTRLVFGPVIFIHSQLFLISNIYLGMINNASYKIKILNIGVCFFYVFSNILLPDGGDTRSSKHVYFGLIKNDLIWSFLSDISIFLFALSYALIFIQIFLCYLHERQQKTPKNI